MGNTNLRLYYRGKRGIKETDIEISNVIRDAKFHYIVTSSSLGMCRSLEDAIQKAAKDLQGLDEWKTVKENILLFNFSVAKKLFNGSGTAGGYWWSLREKKNRLDYFDWLIEQYSKKD